MVMHRISICGKANSGKDTLSKFLINAIGKKIGNDFNEGKSISFAEPIKIMAQTMYPNIPRKFWFGSSKHRAEFIPNMYNKFHEELTIRDVLMDIGKLGRSYNENIWIDNFDERFKKCQDFDVIVVPDVRFQNEFEYLSKKDFYQIRLRRDVALKINDVSEKNQDLIKDTDFDYIIYNNGTLENLSDEVDKIVEILLG